ncbi:MAG: hypothetical protein E6Q40_10775 [Cupriavidus sp.]|nr:MAG: hypothetical protein E6Q40_10775 [Cupriavidus sp.]
MPRFSPLQNSFASGLLSRRLLTREDLEQYGQGMRQAQNGLPMPHGGFQKRTGSYMVAEVRSTTAPVALIPFDVSTEQQYVMEFSDGYIRFFANHGVIESSPGVPYEIASPYSDDDFGGPRAVRTAQQVDVMYLAHPGKMPRKLTRTGLQTFSLAEVSFKDGNAPMQPSNITATTLNVTGSGPYTLTFSAVPRVGGLVSADDVGRAVRWYDAVYKITAVTSTTEATATLLKAKTDPATGATLDWALGLFSDTDGPRSVIFHDGRLWYAGTRMSPDVIVGSVSDDYDNFDRGTNFGSTPTIGEDDKAIVRRVQGKRLQTVLWMASMSNYLIVGSAGGEFRLFASDNGVMTPTNTVVRSATTRGSAYLNPIQTDSQILFTHQSKREFFELKYDVVKDNFSSRNLLLLGEDIPDIDENGLGGLLRSTFQETPDRTVWLVHGDGSLVSLTYEPDQKVIAAAIHRVGTDVVVEDVVSIVNPDNKLQELWFLATYDGSTYVCYMAAPYRPTLPRQGVTERQRMAALDQAHFVDVGLRLDSPKLITGFTKANPVVITCPGHGFSNGDVIRHRVPQEPAELDMLAATIANVTTNTYELTGVDGTAWDDLTVVSNQVTTNWNAPLARKEVSSVSGLTHLAGKEVAVLADGKVHPRRTVSGGGSIDLAWPASIVSVGLPYKFLGETERFVGGTRLGANLGQRAGINQVIVYVLNSVGGKVSVGDGTQLALRDLITMQADQPMDRATPLFTGPVEVDVDQDWSIEPSVYFESDEPLPMTVLAIAPRAEINEG